MKPVDWYFDCLSGYAYLQLPDILALAEETSVTFKPILFAGLLEHHGTKGPAQIASKRVHTYRQWIWQAKAAGIPFRMPPAHPFPPLPPLRLAIALGATGAVVRTIFEHIWRDGEDVGAQDGWRRLLDRLGATGDAPDIEAPAVKDALRSNTEEAIARGLFGVPTAVVDGELFWGNDSTSMLRAYLANPSLLDDPEFVRARDLPRGNVKRD
jgi:2-hydroxychromene-2-carboxylate isomerase